MVVGFFVIYETSSNMENGVYMDTITIPLVPLPEIVSVSGYGSMVDTESIGTSASGDTSDNVFKERVYRQKIIFPFIALPMPGSEFLQCSLFVKEPEINFLLFFCRKWRIKCFILFIDPLPSLSLPSSWSKHCRLSRTLHQTLIWDTLRVTREGKVRGKMIRW